MLCNTILSIISGTSVLTFIFGANTINKENLPYMKYKNTREYDKGLCGRLSCQQRNALLWEIFAIVSRFVRGGGRGLHSSNAHCLPNTLDRVSNTLPVSNQRALTNC